MNYRSYKLGRYEIIESSDGTLRWESHAGMASIKSGKCVVKGDLLIIGPVQNEAASFLKREFLERLSKLPTWDKTNYFCPSHALYKCNTGASFEFAPETNAQNSEPSHPTTRNFSEESQDTAPRVNQEPLEKKVIGYIKTGISKIVETRKRLPKNIFKN